MLQLLSRGDHAMALDLKMLRLKNPQKLVAKADDARDRKDWRQAGSYYKEALAISPRDHAIWVQYGHALKESGQIPAAEEAYRKSIEIAPLVADTHLQLGHVLKLGGRLSDAQSSYREAAKLDPANPDATRELVAINELAGASFDSSAEGPLMASGKPRAIFDCSDLIQYFRDNRLPTGIQRVQINIVTHYMSIDTVDHPVIVYFDMENKAWREISSNDFHRLCNSAQNISYIHDSAWRNIYHQICISSAPAFIFTKGDILINLGTSWWIPDYFVIIRSIKEKYGVFYVPFIHDCIPLITPEFCARGLTEEFRAWLVGVLTHSDGYLVNSQSTATDLAKIADQLGYPVAEPTVVRLDGDTRSNGQFSDASRDGDSVLQREGIPQDAPYILMVGTLEIRKNHLLALKVWDKLMEERGDKCPYLICVGKQGWHFDATMDYFASRRRLAKRVRFISNVSDAALAQLYRKSLFTLYPSHYEGWGLPVTESLCYGKLALVADNSSLTEAGGAFADYFEAGSIRQAHAAIAKPLDDSSYRKSREANIAENFRPRPWSALAQDVAGSVDRLRQAGNEPISGLPHLTTGRVLALKQYDHINFPAGQLSAEHCRMGHGWHRCEAWGTWMKAPEGILGFATDKALKNVTAYLQVRGHPAVDLTLILARGGTDIASVFEIEAASEALLKLNLGDIAAGSQLRLVFDVKHVDDLDNASERQDQRKVGLGISWLALCENTDLSGRLAIFEAINCNTGAPLR